MLRRFIWGVPGQPLIILGVLGVAACLTALYEASGQVMAIGGSCASGNSPYEIATPCPSGVGGLLGASIPLGMLFAGLFVLGALRLRAYAPLVLLAWPALFISLGYDFLRYGLNPGDGRASDGGFLTCAIVFFLMGGGPLLGLLAMPRRALAALRPENGSDVLLGLMAVSVAAGILGGDVVYDAVTA